MVESETISSGIPSAAMTNILRDDKIWSAASVEHLTQYLRVQEESLGCSDRSDVSQDILRWSNSTAPITSGGQEEKNQNAAVSQRRFGVLMTSIRLGHLGVMLFVEGYPIVRSLKKAQNVTYARMHCWIAFSVGEKVMAGLR